MRTYMVLQSKDMGGNNVLGYYHRLLDAKYDILNYYIDKKDVFILKLEGSFFGEGYHQYTLEYNHGNWIKNTKLGR